MLVTYLHGYRLEFGDVVRWENQLFVVLVNEGERVACFSGATRMVGGTPVPCHRIPHDECELLGRYDSDHPAFKKGGQGCTSRLGGSSSA